MKSKKFILFFNIILLLIFIIQFNDCGGSATTETPNGADSDPRRQIYIDHINPPVMPSDSFAISFYTVNFDYGAFIDNYRIHIVIKQYVADTCAVFDTSRTIKVYAANGRVTDSVWVKINDFNNGCNGTDTAYKIRIFSQYDDTLHDSKIYVKGDPILPDMNARIALLRMPDIRQGICDTIQKSIDSTFYNPVLNRNKVRVKFDFSSWDSVPNLNFNATTVSGLIYQLDTFATHHKPITDTNMLIISKLITNFQEIWGITSNTALLATSDWSYVFKENIEDNATLFWPRKTLFGYTAVHEILHQYYGNDTGINSHTNDHDYHLGRNNRICALYTNVQLNTPMDSIFRTHTGFFKICDYHLFKFRSKLSNSVPDNKNYFKTIFNSSILLLSGSGINSEKYEILMNLQKTKYKMYEPVIAKFTVINHDTKQMDIYNLFDAIDKSGPALIITSKNGGKWNSNKIPISFDKFYMTPYYVLQPKDTLYVSMPINNWGQTVRMKSYSDNDVYFDQFGYFQPGKYSAYFYLGQKNSEFYGTELKSNDVEFEIVENTKQDLKLLELYKENKFTEIMSKFPNNKFTEHVIAEYIISKGYNGIYRNSQNNYDSLEYDFENFISKYPESYYLLRGKFISPYIYKLSIGISEPNEVRTKMESKLYNETIKSFLKNDVLIKNILNGKVYY